MTKFTDFTKAAMTTLIKDKCYDGQSLINAIYDTSEKARGEDNLQEMGFKSFVVKRLLKILKEPRASVLMTWCCPPPGR